MGVVGLGKLIEQCTRATRTRKLSDYAGKIIAVDCSIVIYKHQSVGHHRDSSIDPSKDLPSHLDCLIKLVIKFLKYGILPVFVFDSIPPPEKLKTIEKRNKSKRVALDKIEEIEKKIQDGDLSQINDLKKLKSQSITISKQVRDDVRYFLELIGIPVIRAPDYIEAEAVCARLQQLNIVDYTFTDDTDALVYGAKKVLRSLRRGSRQVEYVDEVNLTDFLSSLDLTPTDTVSVRDQFIDMAILAGCDYCSRIPMIGIETSLRLVRTFKTIESVIQHNTKYIIPEEFMAEYPRARETYKTNITDFDDYVITNLLAIQKTNLTRFLMDEKSLSDEGFTKYYMSIKEAKKCFKTIFRRINSL